MARATFTIRRNGKKIGTASFIGKSWKAAKAVGARALSGIGIRSNRGGQDLYGIGKSSTVKLLKRIGKKRKTNRRKRKPANFGKRMARLRKRKANRIGFKKWVRIGTARGTPLFWGVEPNDATGDIYTSDGEPTEVGLFTSRTEAIRNAKLAWPDFKPLKG